MGPMDFHWGDRSAPWRQGIELTVLGSREPAWRRSLWHNRQTQPLAMREATRTAPSR